MFPKGIKEKVNWIYEHRFEDLNKLDQDFISELYMNKKHKFTANERSHIRKLWEILGL